MSDVDKYHCKNIMSKHHRHSKKRHNTTASQHFALKDVEWCSNVSRDATGVDCTLLLLEKAKISTESDDQRELLIEELRCRDIDVDNKTKISILKKLLIDNKHPNPATDSSDKKHFLPKFLAETDWMRDNLSDTLAKIVAMREVNLIVYGDHR